MSMTSPMVIDRLIASTKPSRVVWSARLLGAAGLVQFSAMIGPIWRLTDPNAFRLQRVWGFEPTSGMIAAISVAWLAGALTLLFGRVLELGWLLPPALVLAIGLDRQVTGGHVYLVAIGTALLIGYRLTSKHPSIRRMAPMFLWAFQAQVSIVLFWAAVGKINPRFLSGGVLRSSLGDGLIPVPAELLTPSLLRPAALVVIAVEFFIAAGLWLPRLRAPALLLAGALHAAIALLMGPPLVLLAFGLAMGAGYVLFVPPRQGTPA